MKFPGYYRAPNPLYRKLAFAGLLILGVLLLGTAGYMVLQKWNFLDAVYMTVITITTVGFHEVGALSATGRIFTIVLIFLGIGTAGYAVGNIAAFFVEGQMLDLLRGRKMEKEITKKDLEDEIDLLEKYTKIIENKNRTLEEANKIIKLFEQVLLCDITHSINETKSCIERDY